MKNEERKTITVHGVGRCTARPDCVYLNMTIEEIGKVYGSVIEAVNRRVSAVKVALVKAGICQDEIRTSALNVRAENERRRTESGYANEFKGFICSHRLKLKFDFTTELVNSVLGAVISSGEPDFNLSFGINDKEALADELLAAATRNARHKAETLCFAAGVKLGELINIDYSFGEFDPISPTHLEVRTLSAAPDFSVNPENIDLSDSATFTWSLLGE